MITLSRFREEVTGTMGELRLQGGPSCYILERPKDGDHPRIPAGTYVLALKPIGASRFDNGTKGPDDIRKWMGAAHKGMIEVLDVPGRTEILIHPANSMAQLLGCLAPGMSFDNHGGDGLWVNESRKAYQLIYTPIVALIQGEAAQLTITENFAPGALVA